MRPIWKNRLQTYLFRRVESYVQWPGWSEAGIWESGDIYLRKIVWGPTWLMGPIWTLWWRFEFWVY